MAGLGFRFDVCRFPVWVSIPGTMMFLLSYGFYGETLRENTWLSRTVEVQENQTVVDTGLYGIVRHPMYTVTIFLFLSIPLVLGSWISLLFFLPYPAVIVLRIHGEEALLEKELGGYRDYEKKVRWHLIPGIW